MHERERVDGMFGSICGQQLRAGMRDESVDGEMAGPPRGLMITSAMDRPALSVTEPTATLTPGNSE